MKKCFFAIILLVIPFIVHAEDLTCYYAQDRNGGANSLNDIIVTVNTDGIITAKDSREFYTIDFSNITFKDFLKNGKTSLSCPSSIYTSIPGLPANTYEVYFQYDENVFLLDKCDNSGFCFYGTLDTSKSTADIVIKEQNEPTMTCEYYSDRFLPGTNSSRILYSVTDGVAALSVKGGESKYILTPTDDFVIASTCEEQGSLFMRCHKGNYKCSVGSSKTSNFTLGAYLGTNEIRLVGKDDEIIKDGDEIEEDNKNRVPSNSVEIKFSPTKLCKDSNNCDISLTGFCALPTVSRTLKFVGLLFSIAKILVPAIIIIMGIVNLIKIITSGKDDEVKKGVKTIVTRILIGVVIFLLPGVIKWIFTIADDIVTQDEPSEILNCVYCVLDKDECVVTEKN